MEEFRIKSSRNSKISEQLLGLAGAEGKMATDIEIMRYNFYNYFLGLPIS